MAKNFLYNLVQKYNISKTLFIGYTTTIAVIIYFLFFAVFGQKGLISVSRLQTEFSNRDIVKQGLANKVSAKKQMIEGMNLESLDLDLLDEQARKVLGYANKNEIVIYQDEPNNIKK